VVVEQVVAAAGEAEVEEAVDEAGALTGEGDLIGVAGFFDVEGLVLALEAQMEFGWGDHCGGDALFRFQILTEEEGGAGAIRRRYDEEKVCVGRKYGSKEE
jgi:hypothetical protein